MYRVGSLRRVFRARGKLVGTSDFVVTRGYVQIRVVGFPWETASLEAVVRRQDGALLLRRERAEARLWVYCQRARDVMMTDTRFERVTFVSDALTVAIQASQKVLAQLLTLTRHGTEEPQHRYASALRLRRTVPYHRRREPRTCRAAPICSPLFGQQTSPPVPEARFDLPEDCCDDL